MEYSLFTLYSISYIYYIPYLAYCLIYSSCFITSFKLLFNHNFLIPFYNYLTFTTYSISFFNYSESYPN